MPRPFTGGAGVSPLPSADGSGAALDSPSEAGSGCGAAGFAAADAFFAPGRLAPGAMPSPLTSGSVLVGTSAAGASAVAGAAGAAFLAPGRLAPAAMPSPLVGAAAGVSAV